MKVAIITITNGQNYGNRLQNYALQSTLKDMGCEVETILLDDETQSSKSKELYQLIKDCAKKILHKGKTTFGKRARKSRFSKFNSKYINFTQKLSENDIIKSGISENYDFFICGSDQIWNTRFDFVKNHIGFYLAAFAGSKPKIAYAASFGTSDIPESYYNVFKEQLSDFKALGIREKTGLDIIDNLGIDKHATLVLDPTMLVSKQKWQKFANKPRFINEKEKYIFSYFLGARTEKLHKQIKLISDDYEAKEIRFDIEFLTDNEISYKESFSATPDEFVWAVQNSECVLTDSFHATVFAIIFNKPFVVYNRKASEENNNMNSRIETLLQYFDLSHFTDNIFEPVIMPEKYEEAKIEKRINENLIASVDFLKSALSIND